MHERTDELGYIERHFVKGTKDEVNKQLDKLNREALFDDSWVETRNTKKVGRNQPCPCNSGKKFKKCCMRKYKG